MKFTYTFGAALVAALLATACGPVDSVLLMAGRSWLSLRNSVVALVVNVGLNVVLIPLAGILYAAAGRHPIAGIAAAFAGRDAGRGRGVGCAAAAPAGSSPRG